MKTSIESEPFDNNPTITNEDDPQENIQPVQRKLFKTEKQNWNDATGSRPNMKLIESISKGDSNLDGALKKRQLSGT